MKAESSDSQKRIGTDMEHAARLLAEGQLVAFPTETVYGLGADASSAECIRKLYQAKGRPASHPVIVHLYEFEQAGDWADAITDDARALAETLMPGPVTFVFKRRDSVLDEVTGGQDTVALRVPAHPMARELLERFGSGLAAPSANKFGRLSPTTAADVARDFDPTEVPYILDGGPCPVGIESTIIDLTGEKARILRPGQITRMQIEKALGRAVQAKLAGKESTRVPGSHKSHYAPVTPVIIVDANSLDEVIKSLRSEGRKVAVLSFQKRYIDEATPWIVANPSLKLYARTLYSNLRRLDEEKCDQIVVESVPGTEEWSGVRDRLTRARKHDPGKLDR